jgi:hypothetical protein
MARPEIPITWPGPAADLARALRRLRGLAGNPDYRALAAKAGYSPTTLADAASGKACPSQDVALAYAGACGAGPADLAEVKGLWATANKAHRAARAREARARRRARGVQGNPASPRLYRQMMPPPRPGQPRPDPDGTAAQFVERLRALRAWDGQTSYKAICAGSGFFLPRAGAERWPPRSTVYGALSPKRTTLPSLFVVQVIVAGCSGPVEEWTAAWRAIKLREIGAAEPPAAAAGGHGLLSGLPDVAWVAPAARETLRPEDVHD